MMKQVESAKKAKTFREYNVWRLRKFTPEYVLAHANWRRSQRKNPIFPYKSEQDPDKAVALATSELTGTIGPCDGGVWEGSDAFFKNFARRMITVRRFLCVEEAHCQFNHIPMIVTDKTTVKSLRALYQSYLDIYEAGKKQREIELRYEFYLRRKP